MDRLIAFVVLSGLLGSELQAGLITPTGVNPGDEFRFVFVTSANTTAVSTSIAYYDDFVTGFSIAGGLTTYEGKPVYWQVLGSTSTVAAIDRIPLSSPALYLINGVKVANNGADLWDGSILAPINIDEMGNTQGGSAVWTGTFDNGQGAGDHALGGFGLGGSTNYGDNFVTDSTWILKGTDGRTAGKPVYAVSSIVAVATPEPSSLVLCGVALSSAMLFARRRRVVSRATLQSRERHTKE